MSVRHRRFTLVAVLLPLLAVGCATTQSGQSAAEKPPAAGASAAPHPAMATTPPSAPKPLQPVPPPTELETQVGIQVVHIALTASGGLVDARFKVLDASKATALLANPANAPLLIAGDKPPVMAPHHALKGARYAKDQVFFIIYPNTRSAIQPGIDVMVAIGAARLGPVKAQ